MEPGSGSAWLTLVLAGLISFAVIKTLESKESL